MTDLSGKVALVTGSSRSMGGTILKTLAAAGANVVANARQSAEEAEGVVRECEALGVRAHAVVADVATADGVRKLCDDALEHYGRIDILVNNVGVSPRVGFDELTFDDWQMAFDINVNSVFRTAKALTPGMIENGWGRIVNISGHAYLHIAGKGLHTKASKAALVGLTRGLAGELAEFGITSNHVAPWKIDTPPRRNKYYTDNDPDWDPAARGVDKLPVKRMGKMEEVAAVVRFLCSDEAAYLTGQTYLVNGGAYAV